MTTVWLWLYPLPLKSDVDLAAGEIIHAQWFCEGAAQVAKLGVRSRAPVTPLSRLLKIPPVDTVTDYVRVMCRPIAFILMIKKVR